MADLIDSPARIGLARGSAGQHLQLRLMPRNHAKRAGYLPGQSIRTPSLTAFKTEFQLLGDPRITLASNVGSSRQR
jgi:hypothetical protein